MTDEYDADIRRACRKLPQLKESIRRAHPNSRLEVTLGIGYSKTRQWLARVNLPFPKSFIQFQEKQGPTGKNMPYTGNFCSNKYFIMRIKTFQEAP